MKGEGLEVVAESMVAGTYVRVIGDLTHLTADRLREATEEARAKPAPAIALDLSRTTAIDPTGWQAIIAVLLECAARGGRVALVAPGPPVVAAASRLGLARRVEVLDDDAGARAWAG